MLSLLGDVKGLIKLDKLCIDNNVFRLHYKVIKAFKKKLHNFLYLGYLFFGQQCYHATMAFQTLLGPPPPPKKKEEEKKKF